MSQNDYENFVTKLYQERIEKNVTRIRRELSEEGRYIIPRLTKALHVLRFIEYHFDDEEEIRSSLTPELIDRTLDAAESGL